MFCLQNKKEGMRLTNTENDLFSSGFVLPEHRGGDGWTILHGDALDIIPHFQPGAFDAVITDPPYAGGGAKPSEKTRTTNQKYSSMSADKALPDFDGDQKDQLSWMLWTAVWMSKVRAACKPGAPICVFIDWRQLPALACAMQWAGWIWRGVAVWDKMTSRPQKGRYRQQAEFMVWGSNGPMPLQRKVGCLPGVFRHANPANRIHVTEKPLPLMREVVQICEQGGRILHLRPGQGGVRLALGIGEQNTAQCAAAVSKAYHAVFRIHIDAVFFHKPLRRQFVQLRQRSHLTLFLRHSGVGGAVCQGGDGGICLLHLLYLGSGQGLGGAGGFLRRGSHCRAHCRKGQRNGTHRAEQTAINCMFHFFFSVPLPRHTAGAVVRKAAPTGSL